MSNYRAFFGFKCDPFANDIPAKELLKLPDMVAVKERIDYILNLGGIMLVTGEVGSGKSSSLRWAVSHYHPSQTLVLPVVANSGSVAEMYKTLAIEIGINFVGSSRARLSHEIKNAIRDIATTKKQKILLLVDEAHLMRAEVFAELHTLTQFDLDSKNLLTLVLCGQPSLLDKLHLRTSQPLASRIIAKSHLAPVSRLLLDDYVAHHLLVAGSKKKLFDENALTAIFQGSGGILRKTNALARGGLVAAATEKNDFVSAEHIRIAASELI